MPDINEVCEGLADAAQAVAGLRALPYISANVTAPQAQVYTRPYDPRLVFGDSKSLYQLGLRVMVKASNERTAQRSLRSYMEPSGSTSVRAAIEDSTNWEPTVDYVEVTEVGQPFELEVGSELYWATDFDVDITW
jgi:hypothetical protein